MYCEGRVLDVEGKPVANCTIETWETDDEGLYDTQYSDRSHPDCRGRLHTDENGYYAVRRHDATLLCARGRRSLLVT
jgi:protocatechuate 3,4-dioxygenase beta subunit